MANLVRFGTLCSSWCVVATVLAPLAAAAGPTPIYNITISQAPDPLLNGLTIPANAATQGMWSATQNWPLVALHVTVMPDGRVLTYGTPADGQGVQDGRTLDIWDPAVGFASASHLLVANGQAVDSFCGTAAILPATGTVLLSGGGSAGDGYTSFASTIVDPTASTAANAGFNMAAQRWYGTMTTLADGRPLMTGGGTPYAIVSAYADPTNALSSISTTPEIFTPGTGWQSLFNASSTDAFGPVNNRAWYPRQWVASNGQVFGISTDKMWLLDPIGGTIQTLGNFKTTVDATTLPNVGPTSTAVMYDSDLILQAGGNGYRNGYASPSSPYATIINIKNPTLPALQDISAMTYARQWANSLVLPDGQVLVTGGSTYGDNAGSNAVYAAEIWNPSTGGWTVGANAANYRGYHSATVLLPDGVVLSTGGGAPGPVNNFNAEIYYPPYLFTSAAGTSVLAARPQVVSITGNTFGYGANIGVQMADATSVSEVALIGMSTVTHSFNTFQRRVKLAFTQNQTLLNVTLPASGNLTPPGYYMLSVLNSNRVPAAGVVIALNAATPPATGVTAILPVDSVARAFEASNFPGYVIRHYNFIGYLSQTNPATDSTLHRDDASFYTRQGLAKASCYSFESKNFPGRFLRTSNFGLRLDTNDSSTQFAQDSTFCATAGLRGSGISLQSYEYPTRYLRHRNYRIFLDVNDGTTVFQKDASFFLAQEWLPVDANTHSFANLSKNGDLIRHANFVGFVAPINSANTALNKTDASFYVRAGNASASCYSFESANYPGYFLRNQNHQVVLNQNDSTAQFGQDSTFCLQSGLAGQGFSLTASSDPTLYLRQNNLGLYLNPSDGTAQFASDATFAVVPAP